MTQMPGTYDLNLYRGDTYGWKFVLWQDTNKTIPVDLTGCTAKAEIRDKSGGSKICPIKCTINGTNNNEIDAVLLAADCAGAPNGGWDLQVTFPTGVRTILAGKVKITDDYTDSS